MSGMPNIDPEKLAKELKTLHARVSTLQIAWMASLMDSPNRDESVETVLGVLSARSNRPAFLAAGDEDPVLIEVLRDAAKELEKDFRGVFGVHDDD